MVAASQPISHDACSLNLAGLRTTNHGRGTKHSRAGNETEREIMPKQGSAT
jgi:hypothetical protein